MKAQNTDRLTPPALVDAGDENSEGSTGAAGAFGAGAWGADAVSGGGNLQGTLTTPPHPGHRNRLPACSSFAPNLFPHAHTTVIAIIAS